MPIIRPNIHAVKIESEVLGLDMLVEVTLPYGYDPHNSDQKYPVMYITDAFNFGLMISNNNYQQTFGFGESSPGLIPNIITVAFDFLVPFEINELMRLNYYTPTEAFDENVGTIGGNADLFIDFVLSELKPYIRDNYNTDDNNETFGGHSLGGLLTLYILFTQPQIFDNYIASSPSIYWDDKVLHSYEQAFFEQHRKLQKKVFISAGTDEDPYGIVFGYVKTFSSIIASRNYKKLDLKIRTFEGENHTSVVVNAFAQGARHVLNHHLHRPE
jgi:hypothetical protein